MYCIPQKIFLTNDAIHLLTKDGKEGIEYFSNYKEFKNASKEQLESFETSAFGIHWNKLNIDLSYDGFFKHKLM